VQWRHARGSEVFGPSARAPRQINNARLNAMGAAPFAAATLDPRPPDVTGLPAQVVVGSVPRASPTEEPSWWRWAGRPRHTLGFRND
jgi:hypothetical protein